MGLVGIPGSISLNKGIILRQTKQNNLACFLGPYNTKPLLSTSIGDVNAKSESLGNIGTRSTWNHMEFDSTWSRAMRK